MAFVAAPTFNIRSIQWALDRPAQMNVSAYSGVRRVVANPWHGKWTASAELPTLGATDVLAWQAFLAKCKGQIATFKLPAYELAQNSNSGVQVLTDAAQNATSLTITGAATAMLAGQRITVNDQLLQLTDVAGSTLTFQPPLREAANAGTSVETARPYALVHMGNSSVGWAVSPGRLHDIAFDVEEAVAERIASSHALSLDFDAQQYYVAGTKYAALASVPGYTFTRSGEQGALKLDGTVAFYAANAPAINSRGFHAYAALTNLVLQSQTFDNASWTKSDTTVTANAQAAPDGTTTGDTLTGSGVAPSAAFQTVSATGGSTYTWAFFAKAGTNSWVALGTYDGTTDVRQYYNLSTGALGSAQSGTFTAAGMVACGNGWYLCWATRAIAGGATTIRHQINLATADLTLGNTTGTIHAWQAQAMLGNLNEGGPIITTTTASAAIGESLLKVTDTVGSDADQLFMARGRLRNNSDGRIVSWSDGSANNRVDAYFNGSSIYAIVTAAAAVVYNPSLAYTSSDLVTVVIRRLGGAWRLGIVKDGVLTWAASTTAAFPSGVVTAAPGNYVLGAQAANERVFAIARTLGTFDTDAKVIAAVADIA